MNRKKKSGLFILAVVLIVAVALYALYTFYTNAQITATKNDAVAGLDEGVLPEGVRRLSAMASYDTPESVDNVRFTVTVDEKGVILDVRTEEAQTREVSSQQAKFSENLLIIIKGKKLSELTAIDKVGTSSLTTTAFNGVIDELKAQL